MRLDHIIFLAFLFLNSCVVNSNDTIKNYPINDDFYFEAKTLGNRGYTWLYLCRKSSAERIDIYGVRDSTTDTYFMDIDSIKISKVKGDTLWYTIFETPGNKLCISDSLLLSKRKVLSKTTITTNCQ